MGGRVGARAEGHSPCQGVLLQVDPLAKSCCRSATLPRQLAKARAGLRKFRPEPHRPPQAGGPPSLSSFPCPKARAEWLILVPREPSWGIASLGKSGTGWGSGRGTGKGGGTVAAVSHRHPHLWPRLTFVPFAPSPPSPRAAPWTIGLCQTWKRRPCFYCPDSRNSLGTSSMPSTSMPRASSLVSGPGATPSKTSLNPLMDTASRKSCLSSGMERIQ